MCDESLRDNSDEMVELNPQQMSQEHWLYMSDKVERDAIQEEQDARVEFQDHEQDELAGALDFDDIEKEVSRKRELQGMEEKCLRQLEMIKRERMLAQGGRLFDGILEVDQKRRLAAEVMDMDVCANVGGSHNPKHVKRSDEKDSRGTAKEKRSSKEKQDERGRSFCVTIHAPEEHPERVDVFKAQPWTYYILGKEVCPTTGSAHLQGFGYLNQKCSEAAIRKRLPGIHVEAKSPHSTFKQAIDYCSKQDHSPEVWGTAPMDPRTKGEGQQQLWADTLEHARRGERDLIHPRIQFLHYQNIDYHRAAALQSQRFEPVLTKHLWCWGKTGTGKSKWVRDTYDPEQEGKFFLKGSGKWWDGYANQEVVLIEDWGLSHVKEIGADLLKIWADVYPFQAEIKGRAFQRIRPRLIIVNSNYKPEDLWTDDRELQPLLRRFELREFVKLEEFDRT